MFKDFERPILTVDIVLLTVQSEALCVVLQRRDKPPHTGELALIGGYVRVEEDANARATAERVLAQKAKLTGIFMEQLMTFSGPTRDERGWSASIVYYGLVPEAVLNASGPSPLTVVPVAAAGPLPFDHAAILNAAVGRLRTKGAYSSLPAFLLPATFTLSQLRRVYERVMGVPLNDSAFRRKIDDLDLLEPVTGVSKATARPAQLFRLKDTALKEFDRKI